MTALVEESGYYSSVEGRFGYQRRVRRRKSYRITPGSLHLPSSAAYPESMIRLVYVPGPRRA
jgi:hypothetical protein